MIGLWIIIAIGYFTSAHLIGKYLGKNREIGYWESIFWSAGLSPFLGLIITLGSKKVNSLSQA